MWSSKELPEEYDYTYLSPDTTGDRMMNGLTYDVHNTQVTKRLENFKHQHYPLPSVARDPIIRKPYNSSYWTSPIKRDPNDIIQEQERKKLEHINDYSKNEKRFFLLFGQTDEIYPFATPKNIYEPDFYKNLLYLENMEDMEKEWKNSGDKEEDFFDYYLRRRTPKNIIRYEAHIIIDIDETKKNIKDAKEKFKGFLKKLYNEYKDIIKKNTEAYNQRQNQRQKDKEKAIKDNILSYDIHSLSGFGTNCILDMLKKTKNISDIIFKTITLRKIDVIGQSRINTQGKTYGKDIVLDILRNTEKRLQIITKPNDGNLLKTIIDTKALLTDALQSASETSKTIIDPVVDLVSNVKKSLYADWSHTGDDGLQRNPNYELANTGYNNSNNVTIVTGDMEKLDNGRKPKEDKPAVEKTIIQLIPDTSDNKNYKFDEKTTYPKNDFSKLV